MGLRRHHIMPMLEEPIEVAPTRSALRIPLCDGRSRMRASQPPTSPRGNVPPAVRVRPAPATSLFVQTPRHDVVDRPHSCPWPAAAGPHRCIASVAPELSTEAGTILLTANDVRAAPLNGSGPAVSLIPRYDACEQIAQLQTEMPKCDACEEAAQLRAELAGMRKQIQDLRDLTVLLQKKVVVHPGRVGEPVIGALAAAGYTATVRLEPNSAPAAIVVSFQ